MAKTREKKSSSIVKIARPGIGGLITGIAPEDLGLDNASSMWNMRSDELGRLNIRPGYEVKYHSLNSGADLITMLGTTYNSSGNPTTSPMVIGMSTTAIKFYYGDTLIKSRAASPLTTYPYMSKALLTGEIIPMYALFMAGVCWKQYMSGSTCRYAEYPFPTGPSMPGVSAADQGAGTFQNTETYRFKIAYYNSITGEYGKVSSNYIERTPAGVNVGQRLTSVPVSSDADEGADLYRKIYCASLSESYATYYLVATISDNSTTQVDIANAPVGTEDSNVTFDDPPSAGTFAATCYGWGRLWVAANDAIYYSKSTHAMHFDTTSNKLTDFSGTPLKMFFLNDRIIIITTNGVFHIPHPGLTSAGALNTDNLRIARHGGPISISPKNANTIVEAGGTIMCMQTGELRAVYPQDVLLSRLGVSKLMKMEIGDFDNYSNIGYYDIPTQRYMLLCYLGARDGSVLKQANKDILIFNKADGRWEHDIYAGLFPCSIERVELSLTGAGRPPLVVGGTYGVMAYVEGGYSTGVAKTEYLYDGQQSALISGTATGGSTTTVVDTAAAFTDSVIGNSCVVFRASVSDNGKKAWQYKGVAPVKSRTGTQLTFGHSIGFTVAAGDLYYIGAVPWLVKTPSLVMGRHVIDRVEVEHIGAMSNIILVVPDNPDRETGWMSASTGVLQKTFSDARTGLRAVSIGVNMSAESPQIQLCGYRTRPEITSITGVLKKLLSR